MAPVLTVLFVLAASLVVVRVATVGLTLTGVSKDLAQFQALSAFTRCGYTTRETEDIVNHPVRRRIIMHLMLWGNAGIVLAIASVLSLFLGTTEGTTYWVGLIVLSAGILALWALGNSQYVERAMWQLHVVALKRWAHLEVQDYTALLRLAHDYSVSELKVHQDDWLEGRTLGQLKLTSEGVLVLGIERANGAYVGTPKGDTTIQPGDLLIVYGRQECLMELHTRQAGIVGNLHHVMAVTRQIDIAEQESRGTEPGEE